METYTINKITTYAEKRDITEARCWVTNYQNISDCSNYNIDPSVLPLDKMKRGDLIMLNLHRSRNEDVRIFDGEKIIDLSDEFYGEGHLPAYFTINEFTIKYFDVIDCDYTRHILITKELRKEMLTNIKIIKNHIYTSFILSGKKFILAIYYKKIDIVEFETMLHEDLIHVALNCHTATILENEIIADILNYDTNTQIIVNIKWLKLCKYDKCCSYRQLHKYDCYNFKDYGSYYDIDHLISQFCGNELDYCKRHYTPKYLTNSYLSWANSRQKEREEIISKIKKIIQ